MEVKKAIITTAGYSTRFLPVCKSIPKPMLPIQEVPIIHELVKECIDGGITDIILVTSFGNDALEDYFDSRPDLETHLVNTGKEERYKRFGEVFGKASVISVRQNRALPYGSGSAILAAEPWISAGEPFAVIYGDDLVLSNESAIGQLKKIYESKQGNLGGVIAVQKVAEEDISKYGSVKFKNEIEGLIESLLEKPTAQEAPSLLGSYGRYIVSYDIFKYLHTGGLINNELYFSKAIDDMAKEKDVYAKEINGEWLTTGDPLSYTKAVIKYAMRRDEFREEIKKIVNS
ncbi:MAG: sugar phosphate nucleotidyltransferase [Dysgonamonadaceae bacterium]|nr:sugar phosphate nucleotidyltransferase [Dysgonamonadaceae bacterium]